MKEIVLHVNTVRIPAEKAVEKAVQILAEKAEKAVRILTEKAVQILAEKGEFALPLHKQGLVDSEVDVTSYMSPTISTGKKPGRHHIAIL